MCRSQDPVCVGLSGPCGGYTARVPWWVYSPGTMLGMQDGTMLGMQDGTMLGIHTRVYIPGIHSWVRSPASRSSSSLSTAGRHFPLPR